MYLYCFCVFVMTLIIDICAVNTLNNELNLIYHLLALLGAHHILHVSRVRFKHAR